MARIALVEDNEDNRMLIEAIVDGQHELDQYVDGASALEGMAKQVPDLVLLDVSLPQMSGVEVLRAMKEHPVLRSMPTLVLTAHAMDGDRERLLAEGFDAYFSKPIVDDDALLRLIGELLGGRS